MPLRMRASLRYTHWSIQCSCSYFLMPSHEVKSKIFSLRSIDSLAVHYDSCTITTTSLPSPVLGIDSASVCSVHSQSAHSIWIERVTIWWCRSAVFVRLYGRHTVLTLCGFVYSLPKSQPLPLFICNEYLLCTYWTQSYISCSVLHMSAAVI